MNKAISLYADTIFKNGIVLTMDEENSICQAVAVKNNKIIAVGDDLFVHSFGDENTEIIDANGGDISSSVPVEGDEGDLAPLTGVLLDKETGEALNTDENDDSPY